MRPNQVILLAAISIVGAASGCNRPPAAPSQQQAGPPKVVIVDAQSEQGKALLEAAKDPHVNFWAPVPANQTSLPVAPPPKQSASGDSAPLRPAAPPMTAPAATPPTAPAAPPAATPPATAPPAAAPTAPAVQSTPPAAASNGAVSAPSDTRAAAADVGKKAKEYGSGFITTPVGALVTVREKMPMLQIEHALQIFVTQNDRPPRDLAEFSEQILKPASIKLPDLGEGQSYFFDPKEGRHGTLMIRRPAQPRQ